MKENNLGVTQESLLAHARAFDMEWPRLAQLMRGRNIVVHDAPRQLNLIRTRVRAANIRDVSRHWPLVARLTSPTNWDALESGQPAPLTLLIADILQRPAPNSVETTAREVLALFEDEEASFEQAARLNQGGGFPPGLDTRHLRDLDASQTTPFHQMLQAELGARDAKKAYKTERFSRSRDSSLGSGGGSRPPSSASVAEAAQQAASVGSVGVAAREMVAGKEAAVQPHAAIRTGGTVYGRPDTGGMGGPSAAPGNPPFPLHSRSLSDSSAPVGVSTSPAIAGNVSRADLAQGVSTTGTAVVQRMEEGEVANGTGPGAEAVARAAGLTGSPVTPSGPASDKPANP